MALSRKEAVTFLTDVLEVPSDLISDLLTGSEAKYAESFTKNKAEILQSILVNFFAKEPFQCISLMATEASKRRRPEWPEIKERMFLKQGGLCYSNNSFAFVLLKTLGFDASLGHSTVVGDENSTLDNHLVVLIHSLFKDGDLFLVDFAMGYLIPRAVSLDFDEESPEYTDSFHTYKLIRESLSKIVVMQRPVRSIVIEGALSWSDFSSDPSVDALYDALLSLQPESNQKETLPLESDWKVNYFFDPTQKHQALEEFFPCFDVCYENVPTMPMHSHPRALCWPGGKVLALVGSKIAIENSQGHLLKYDVSNIVDKSENGGESKESSGPSANSHDEFRPDSKDSPDCPQRVSLSAPENEPNSKTTRDPTQVHPKLVKAYQTWFPQLPRDKVVSALENWSKVSKKSP